MGKKEHNGVSRIVLAIVFVVLLLLPMIIQHKIHSGSRQLLPDTNAALTQFGFYIEDVSEKSGVSFIHQAPRLDPTCDPILPEIASMGASVSVCDYDNDGWNDFYVTSSAFGKSNELYRNERNGVFSAKGKETGLADLNNKYNGVSMGSVWADFDNDGYEDVFIYRWGKPALFKNIAGSRFMDVTDQSGLPPWINANTAIWFDYNSDGLVDLFIGGYFPENVNLWKLENTRVLTESFEYSQNGGRNYLFRNLRNGKFEDVTFSMGLTSTRWTLAAGATDLNHDGFPELIISNDFGIDEFYLNNKGENFSELSEGTMIGFSPKSGMNVSFGDIQNQGTPGIYISNITEEGILMQGNNFWMPSMDQGRMVYRNEATKFGIESGGWSYSAQFGDLNNDGYIDLYLANGYISGKKGTDYWYDYSKVTGGNKAIISDIKNWPALKGRSHSGYQQNKIWINENGSYFTEASNIVASKETFDSRGVALADLWNRGVLDIIVANQNAPVIVFKNHCNKQNNWIDFSLEGKQANHSAIGALVELFWNHQTQVQTVTGGIGFCSENQRRLHFGLGKNTIVDKAVITWPGGTADTIINPPINQLYRISQQ